MICHVIFKKQKQFFCDFIYQKYNILEHIFSSATLFKKNIRTAHTIFLNLELT